MSLQQQLFTHYLSFRQALDQPTADAALGLLDQTGLPASASELFRSLWASPEKKQWMKTELYPEISEDKGIGVREDGDWAACYFVSSITIGINGEETTQVAITVARFHQVAGQWKLYQQMSSASPYEEDDWSNPQEKLDQIIQSRTNLKPKPENG